MKTVFYFFVFFILALATSSHYGGKSSESEESDESRTWGNKGSGGQRGYGDLRRGQQYEGSFGRGGQRGGEEHLRPSRGYDSFGSKPYAASGSPLGTTFGSSLAGDSALGSSGFGSSGLRSSGYAYEPLGPYGPYFPERRASAYGSSRSHHSSYGNLRGFVDTLPADLAASVHEVEKQMPMEREHVGSVSPGDVKFYLYTQLKPYPTQIVPGNMHLIDRSKPTKYIVHDWLQNSEIDWVIRMKDNYLSYMDMNVITVDWKRPAWSVYGAAAAYVEKVAEHFATHLMATKLSVDTIHVIGFGMGAQIAGHLGKKVTQITVGQKLARISALDPAGPAFQEGSYTPDQKLINTDADMVDVTHSDKQVFGYTQPLGTVDFFPNGGARDSPGCMGSDLIEDGVSCSHTRSVNYFIESIRSQRFVAIECGSFSDYVDNKCSANPRSVYGELTPKNTKGKFFFRTNSQAPYAQG